MEKLLSERGYFELLGNDHILVYYPIISYQRITVIGSKQWIWEDYSGTMESVEN